MNLKKKLALGFASTVLGAALVGGGTFALFTDSAVNEGNTFSAGTVEIEDVTEGASFSTSTFIENLAPGDSEEAVLTIQNNGSLDAWVKVDNIETSANDDPTDGVGDLFEGDQPVNVQYEEEVVLIPAGETHTFDVGYDFPLAAGNEYQGDSGEVTFNIEAVQARNNTNADETGPNNWQ